MIVSGKTKRADVGRLLKILNKNKRSKDKLIGKK